jgi:hypothetical protein
MAFLFSIDSGVRTGLALFNDNARLIWYRSHNYGSRQRLKQDVSNILGDLPGPGYLILEGGGDMAAIWEKEAARKNIGFIQIYAEEWRKDFFDKKEMRNARQAKSTAIDMAQKAIKWSGGKKPTSLTHDVAEAILIGVWGLYHLGWIAKLPEI